jgi:hypothetical protein
MSWVFWQRVYREEEPELVGTVTEVSSVEIKVVWDNGGISFHQRNGPISLKIAKE